MYHSTMNTQQKSGRLFALAISALGVVFGDIGTSPLYALRESFAPSLGLSTDSSNVIGIVSVLMWTLTLVVCVKYLSFVLRADNKGEGGILALVSLMSKYLPKKTAGKIGLVTILGITGAALLYSDGMLTPAVTVLSSIEGLVVFNPNFAEFVLPITLVILVLLFPFQNRGTEKIGMIFGPIMIFWFVIIGFLGIVSIVGNPAILCALNPAYAVSFLFHNGLKSLGVMGSVFLAMTGAEVLYSDLGHFGASPIRRSWFMLVYPALILNYMGQGAHLLSHPDQVENLFYRLAPAWSIIPLVVLATMASVIASQAVISGAFSLARQSVQLGLWPRVGVKHTSDEKIGQVYVPFVNWFIMIGTISLVLMFKTSGKLSHAYGITVSATMLITTLLMVYLGFKSKKLPLWVIIPLGLFFFIIDSFFFIANVTKIVSGGWIVVLLACGIFFLMKTWVDGSDLFRKKLQIFRLDLADFAQIIEQSPPTRVKGTAIFFSANPKGLPKALLHNLKHNRVLHELTIILSVQTAEEPYVADDSRISVQAHPGGIYHVVMRFGFSETPDVPKALDALHIPGFTNDTMQITYFLGREAVAIGPKSGEMASWRKLFFMFLFKNAESPTDYFRLPADRVVEIGSKTEL
jgi:KUP system potassium uptake protein